ncbi:hypothetical protein SISNIDRAFT_459919 [Sistotremastrum niveocremeum HHB9708]|uniref:RRN6 K-rich C-terminal domain-containing protein n=1 Tax=Sistotremastrum niveocremeum HHB9708 TaxID=1314777 RepID=A0A164P7D0_9AGAM|nr:hypothetical protein SISNIDRAFT_459919 [Sistotremastrum niveocremeum HHB9708]
MEWPTTSNRRPNVRTGKKRRKTQAEGRRWDAVELVGGSAGAATLVEDERSGLQWTFVSKDDGHPKICSLGPHLRVFPETKPPEVTHPEATSRKLAEQGAMFLRSSFPDLDIPIELIEDEYKDLAAKSKDSSDRSYGNRITHVKVQDEDGAVMDLLAFPSGQLGDQLNLSPFHVQSDSTLVFCPSASGSASFRTPIQQIEGSSTPSPLSLVVRDFTSVSFLQITASTVRGGAPSLQPVELAFMGPEDTSDKTIADMSMKPSGSSVLFVNAIGELYAASINDAGSFSLTFVCATRSDELSIQESDSWRVKWSSNESQAFATSDSALYQVHIRSRKSLCEWHPREDDGKITSVTESSDGSLICVTTTLKMMWFDSSDIKRPLMTWKHERQPNVSLKTLSVTVGSFPVWILQSRESGVTAIYDVSREEGNLIYSWRKPYSLDGTGFFRPSSPRAGTCLMPIPGCEPETFALFELSERGAIYQTLLQLNDTSVASNAMEVRDVLGLKWDARLENLASTELRANVGALGQKKKITIDLSRLYKRLFICKEPNIVNDEEYSATARSVNDRIIAYLKAGDATQEPNMFTTFDLTFRTSVAPRRGRSSFLSGTDLHGPLLARHMHPDDIPIQLIKNSALWRHNHHKTLQNLDPYFPSDFANMADYLSQFNTIGSTERPLPENVLRIQQKVCERLALDFRLSMDIFSWRGFQSSITNPESNSPEESLDSTPSQPDSPAANHTTPPLPLTFSFLRPAFSETGKAGVSNGEQPVPIGVRLLLQEWTIGENPRSYKYKDPYTSRETSDNESESELFGSGKVRDRGAKSKMKLGVSGGIPALQPSQPPRIMSSQTQTQPPAFLQRARSLERDLAPPRFGTQLPASQKQSGFSQELLPATQPVAGPFASRANGAKKPKKRTGGF